MPGHGWAMQSAPDTSLPFTTFPCRFKQRNDDQESKTGIISAFESLICHESPCCSVQTASGRPHKEKMNPLAELLHTISVMPSSPLEASRKHDFKSKRKVRPVIPQRTRLEKITAKMCQAAKGSVGWA